MLWNIPATFRFEFNQARRRRVLWALAMLLVLCTSAFLDRLLPDFQASGPGPYEIQRLKTTFINFEIFPMALEIAGPVMAGLGLFLALHLLTGGRRRTIENILYTKPVSIWQLECGRFLSIILILTLLSLFPLGTFLYFFHQHRYVPWSGQDFLTLWLLGLVLPMVQAAAVAFPARRLSTNPLISGAAGIILLGILYLFGEEYGLSAFYFIRHADSLYHSPIGFFFPAHEPWLSLAGSLCLSGFFIGLSAGYSRRIIPDRKPFLILLPDRRSGMDTLLTTTLFAAGIMAVVFSARSLQVEVKNGADRLTASSSSPGLSIEKYNLDINFNPRNLHLQAQGEVILKYDGPREATQASLLLNPGLHSVEFLPAANDQKPEFEKEKNLFQVQLNPPLLPEHSRTLHFKYQGRLEGKQLSPVWQLTEKDLFYPVLFQPEYSETGPGFFSCKLDVHLPRESYWLAPGCVTAPDGNVFFPLSQISILGGPFQEIKRKVAGTPVRILTLPGRQVEARLFVEDMEYMLRDTLEYLGQYPYPELVIYDTAEQQPMETMPAAAAVALDGFARWRRQVEDYLQRYDKRLNRRQYYVLANIFDAEQLQDKIIDSAFKEAVLPVGSYREMFNQYLPEYMQMIMRPGPNLIGRIQNPEIFDVAPNLKSIYAQPLARLLENRQIRPQPARIKALSLFHITRYQLGEEKFNQLIQDYLDRFLFSEFTFEDFSDLASSMTDQDLAGFYQEWFEEPLLPEYGITRAEAWMYDDPEQLGMEYEVRLEITSSGTGQIRTPVLLKTEGDEIIRYVDAKPGETVLISLQAPDRPIYAQVDPLGWILQGQYQYDKKLLGRLTIPLTILDKEPVENQNPHLGSKSSGSPETQEAGS